MTIFVKILFYEFSSGGSVSVKPNENGEYVLSESVSSAIFKTLLDFYTTGIIRCPLGVSVSELR